MSPFSKDPEPEQNKPEKEISKYRKVTSVFLRKNYLPLSKLEEDSEEVEVLENAKSPLVLEPEESESPVEQPLPPLAEYKNAQPSLSERFEQFEKKERENLSQRTESITQRINSEIFFEDEEEEEETLSENEKTLTIDFKELSKYQASFQDATSEVLAPSVQKLPEEEQTATFDLDEIFDQETLQKSETLPYEKSTTRLSPQETHHVIQTSKKKVVPTYTIVPSEKVDDYYLGNEPLGEGAGSHIFLAYEDEARNHFAGVLKLGKAGYEKQIFKEIEFARRLLREELHHPNIVKYLKVGMTSNGEYFVVNEYLNTFPRAPITLEDAFCIITKIAEAINYLHQYQIFHRDIKPENIRFTLGEKGAICPKLFDFGTVITAADRSKGAACSPYFAAPEVLQKIRGFPSLPLEFSRVDVFSLGMTFLGLLEFNPYLYLDPFLEQNIKPPEIGKLMDELISVHQTKQDEFIGSIKRLLRIRYKWTYQLQNKFGIPQKPHQIFVEKVTILLEHILSVDPKHRLTCSELLPLLQNEFEQTYSCSVDEFLANGSSFS